MSQRLPACVTLLLACILATGSVLAGEKVYSWRDRSGQLHFTDNIEQVPEPYRTQFLEAEQRARRNAGTSAAPATTRPTTPPTPRRRPPQPLRRDPPSTLIQTMERDATQRKRWRALARQARDRLAQAERKLAAAEQKYATSRRRWIETRVIARRQEAERLEAQITELKKAVAEARTALEVTLPDSARREGVPPGWLRE